MGQSNDLASMIGRDRQTREADRLIIEVCDNYVVVNKSLKISMKLPETILVLEDEFKSSYECKACGGKGVKRVTCLKCEGSGKVEFCNMDKDKLELIPCGRCDGAGYRDEGCTICNGKGVSIELPDTAKLRPTSGRIVSMGPNCSIYKLGDRIAYSNYIGHDLPFKGNNRLKIMGEKEAFVLLENIPGADENMAPSFVDNNTPYPTVL